MLLIGAAGSGKSTFARKHFKSTEIVSSDALRAVVSDEEGDQSASADAFSLLRLIVRMRLRRGKLTVIDATNVLPAARKSLLALAAKNSAPAIGIVLNLPTAVCVARNQSRPGRQVSPEIIEKQAADLLASLTGLRREPFKKVYLLENVEDIHAAQVFREPPKT